MKKVLARHHDDLVAKSKFFQANETRAVASCPATEITVYVKSGTLPKLHQIVHALLLPRVTARCVYTVQGGNTPNSHAGAKKTPRARAAAAAAARTQRPCSCTGTSMPR